MLRKTKCCPSAESAMICLIDSLKFYGFAIVVSWITFQTPSLEHCMSVGVNLRAMIDWTKSKLLLPATDSDFARLNGSREIGLPCNTARPYTLINMAYDQLITCIKYSIKLYSWKMAMLCLYVNVMRPIYYQRPLPQDCHAWSPHVF